MRDADTSGERSRNMNTGRAFTLKRVGGLTGLAGTLTVAAALMASQAVAAGGNPSFEGLLSAPSPSGFMSSPASYDISGGPVTVDFDIVATNITNSVSYHRAQLLRSSHPHVQRCERFGRSAGSAGDHLQRTHRHDPGVDRGNPAFQRHLEPEGHADSLAHVHIRRVRLLPARRVGTVRGCHSRPGYSRIRLHPRPWLR